MKIFYESLIFGSGLRVSIWRSLNVPTVIGIIFPKKHPKCCYRIVACPTLSKSSVDFQDSRVIPPRRLRQTSGPLGVEKESCTVSIFLVKSSECFDVLWVCHLTSMKNRKKLHSLKETIVFQPSIFRGELLVSGMVSIPEFRSRSVSDWDLFFFEKVWKTHQVGDV